MAKTEKYFVGPQLLGEIRQTITRVAGMPDRAVAGATPVRLQELPRRAARQGIERVTFTGAWNKNAVKLVTFFGTTATASALNVLSTVNTSCDDPRNAFVARVSGQWHLLAAECA